MFGAAVWQKGVFMVLDYSQNGIALIFEITESGQVLLRRFASADASVLPFRKEPKERWLSIVDVHVTGCDRNDHHAAKQTGASGLDTLKYVTHRNYKNEIGEKIEFDLADDRMAVTVHYQLYRDVSVVRSWTTVINHAEEDLGLEYITSFAYTGLDAGTEHPNRKMKVWIPNSTWRREFDWKERTLSDCGLQEINSFGLNRVNLSNTGSWSSKEYLPMGAVRNAENGNMLLWQIESNGSWQWEIGDIDNVLYLKLSGPTEQENHWYKALKKGEAFETVKVAVAVGTDLEDVLAQMTRYRRRIVRRVAADRHLPVIFNDYMYAISGNPTEERLKPVIDAAADAGAEYFVIDAGWYADPSGTWWDRVGEWKPDPTRFPNGIRAVLDYIRLKGMLPGLWLELEVVGIHSPIAEVLPDEAFIRRHGKRVIDHGRYILDFRNEKARAHATEAYERVINEYGAAYIKTDYNVEIGIGTDVDSDSMGDGLLSHCRAFKAWCDEMRTKYPEVIIENCSSGSMRMDYLMLENRDLQSITDQERYYDTARIAAAAALAVIPEQSAIWAYPRDKEDLDATACNMINALLQRIHLAGSILTLSDDQRLLVREAIALYKSYRHEIPQAIPIYPCGLPGYETGIFASGYRYPSCSRIAVWRMDTEEDTIRIPITSREVKILYPLSSAAVVTRGADSVTVKLPERRTAVLLEVL